MNALGMNLRNHIIKISNRRDQIVEAKDKIGVKNKLAMHGIPVPETYGELLKINDIHRLDKMPPEFVIKPDRGSGGKGVLILKRVKDHYVSPSNKIYSVKNLKRHMERILEGEFSEYIDGETVLIEERIHCSGQLQFKGSVGLPDVRMFVYNYDCVLAMLRYPTWESDGKANLSQGALGMALDMETGEITKVYSKKRREFYPVETLGIPKGYCIPKWKGFRWISHHVARLLGLRFSGVDLTMDERNNIKVLEVNGYPGLEIQNVTETSLKDAMKWTGSI